MKIQAQKGTKDILPEQAQLWKKIEDVARDIFKKADYGEVKTPIFEATELFARGVGDSTDIVNKEMYTFEKSGRSITLRPENTASVVRCLIEHALYRQAMPLKYWYMGPMFRYERPQSGRQRQFHQLGVEVFGSKHPSCDAEVISVGCDILKNLGLEDLVVYINSIGCDSCRAKFKADLKLAIQQHLDNLCQDCHVRYDKNPLRILDCKNASCKSVIENDQIISNLLKKSFICEDCKEHFESVLSHLNAIGIKYEIDRKMVRGLDYYNRTVFEIKSDKLGAQNAIAGGGRYDKLVSTLNGPDLPAFGFAIGIERLASLIKKDKPYDKLDYFVISSDSERALFLVNTLRHKDVSVEMDYGNRSLTKQLDKAIKKADFALIYSDDEIQAEQITIKNLTSFLQLSMPLAEFIDKAKNFTYTDEDRKRFKENEQDPYRR